AKINLAPAGNRATFACQPIQSFSPAKGAYDLIWIQWVIGSLTDSELLAFLARCREGLAPGGVIVLKDNCIVPPHPELVEGKYLVDETDKTVIRTVEHTQSLFCDGAGLSLLARAPAELRRDDIHPVINFAFVDPRAQRKTSAARSCIILTLLVLVLVLGVWVLSAIR
ncbi:MAG: hypothetical protein SGPRY_010849, partial [Prymnesium sp.]